MFDINPSNRIHGFVGRYVHFQPRPRDGIWVQRIHSTLISNAELHRVGDFIRQTIQEASCGDQVNNED